MKTRTTKTTKITAEATEPAKSVASKFQLAPESTNPPHLFVLPDGLSPEARILSIKNPRYADDDRYLVCPENGFYAFNRVAPPKSTPRSWLLNPADEDSQEKDNSFVLKSADLFVATPIDPLFFLLPALSPQPKNNSEPAKRLFLAGDDYLERVTASSPDLSAIIRIVSLRTKLEKRMTVICDTVEAGDEVMFRLNEEKLLKEVLKKAKKMADKGLPASMEEKFVRKALEVPMMSIKRDDSSLSELVNEEEPVRKETEDMPDTQSTANSMTTSFSERDTAATSFSEDSGSQPSKTALPPINSPEGVADLLRLQTALLFICSAYLPPHLTTTLKEMMASPSSPVDFEPLTTQLAHLTKLRQQAMASRSLGDYSRKRSMNEDDEEIETRAEKKRKKDEEGKRKKAGESRGVRDLKKVNISGMKKMSDFFTKKA